MDIKRIRFFLESIILRAGLLFVPILPRRIIRLLAYIAGHMAYTLSGKLRRIALVNTETAFGGKKTKQELRAIARKSFLSIALVMLDFLWFTRNTAARITKYVIIDPSIKKDLAKLPVIGVTAHFGNWELISSTTAMMGIQHAAVFAGLKNPYVTPFLTRLRNSEGVEAIRKEGAIGKLLKTLRKGKSIALLLDQNVLPDEGGMFVNFFGLPATFSGAAGLLAERTGVPVVILFCMLRDDGTYLFYSLPPLTMDDSVERTRGDGEEEGASASKQSRKTSDNASLITREIVQAFEAEIAKHPEQWLWMYKRWKFIAPEIHRDAYPFYSRPARP